MGHLEDEEEGRRGKRCSSYLMILDHGLLIIGHGGIWLGE